MRQNPQIHQYVYVKLLNQVSMRQNPQIHQYVYVKLLNVLTEAVIIYAKGEWRMKGRRVNENKPETQVVGFDLLKINLGEPEFL